MNFARSHYLNELNALKWNRLIKVITGCRRVGKSYLLNEIFRADLLKEGVPEDHIIRFAFDNDENVDALDDYFPELPTRLPEKNGAVIVSSKKFRAFLKEKTKEPGDYYLLLEKIQRLENFVGTLKGLLSHDNFDVYVTGSNSRFLSSDIITEFRGRSSSLHVLPLSFREFCEGRSEEKQALWKEYIRLGGIPMVANMVNASQKEKTLKNLGSEVYLKDIVHRHRIQGDADIAELFALLASSIGAGVSPLKLERTYKTKKNKSLSDDTIKKYIDLYEDSFLLSKALPYDIKGKRYINAPFKVYFEDVGIRNAILDFRQVEEPHLMENVIYNELRARGYSVSMGRIDVNEPTDRLDASGKRIYAEKALEVDFIAERGDERIYIQSCLNLLESEKEEREKRPFSAITDSFRKIIVTKDGLGIRKDQQGIITVDLFDFLLGNFC